MQSEYVDENQISGEKSVRFCDASIQQIQLEISPRFGANRGYLCASLAKKRPLENRPLVAQWMFLPVEQSSLPA